MAHLLIALLGAVEWMRQAHKRARQLNYEVMHQCRLLRSARNDGSHKVVIARESPRSGMTAAIYLGLHNQRIGRGKLSLRTLFGSLSNFNTQHPDLIPDKQFAVSKRQRCPVLG